MANLPTLTDRSDETLQHVEKLEESWRKTRLKCELKIKQAENELKSFGCGKKRTGILRGAIMAYEDVLSLGNEK